MTDNEIVKALEKKIHLVEYIDGFAAEIVELELLKSTLDLIKRQQAEIAKAKSELVKCKDCKHFLFDTDFCKKNNRGYCEFDNTIKAKSHFCGYGERKDNGTKRIS